MDYLDPDKQRQHTIMLFTGYFLIGIAILIGTFILVYQAYGFGVSRDGTVTQTGLTFFSSQPHPAGIYVNGVLKPAKTNTRLSLLEGIYDIQLKRDGYRTWQRRINLVGGRVEHFDYPLLFANTLTPKKVDSYAAAPGFSSQSPDRRWLVVEQANSETSFDVYDLKSPAKAPLAISIPAGVISKSAANSALAAVDWSDDNQHLLLRHDFDGKSEYILLDRNSPDQTVNLNTSLSISPAKLAFRDKKYDQYYMFDSASGILQRVSQKSPTPEVVQQHVINFQSYGNDTILYATDTDAPAGKVLVKMQVGTKTSNIRSLSAGSNYLLDLTEYSGTMYVAIGASAENKLYIYKDPIAQLSQLPNHAPVPIQVLHVTSPNYLSFSANAQFIMIENRQEFAVYDNENKIGYHYTSSKPLDSPQLHAAWMDGDRLNYVSGGKLVVFDYDYANVQTLVNSDSNYLAGFTPDYKYVFNLTPSAASGQIDMAQTPLLAPADQ